MSMLLQTAFEKARELPEEEQERLARLLLAEMGEAAGAAQSEGDRRWAELLARPESDAFLRKLAAQAREERRAGKTIPLERIFDNEI